MVIGTSMLDLIETMFPRYGIQNLRYDGKMNREAREAVLARFRKPGGPKVILIRYGHPSPCLVIWYLHLIGKLVRNVAVLG